MANDEKLSLAVASTIVDAVLAKGRDLRLLPLTVAVLDSGGHLIALKRDDESGIMRPEIAIGKAWGSRIAGAALDVLEEEPWRPDSRLRGLDLWPMNTNLLWTRRLGL